MVDTKGARDLGNFDSLSTEQRESLAAKAQQTAVKPPVVAFLVVLTPDGGAMAHADPHVLDKFDATAATVAQIHGACHIIADDIVASKAGQVTATYLQQQAMAAAEQAKNQQAWAAAQAQNGHHR